MRPIKPRFLALSLSLVCALFVAAGAADDSVWTSQQDRFSITLPGEIPGGNSGDTILIS